MTRTGIAALTVAGLAGLASASISNGVTVYSLINHPDGAVNPQDYGIRLDNFGDSGPVTFSFEDQFGISTVFATLDATDPGNATFTAQGTIQGNSANGGTDFGIYSIFFQYNGEIDGDGNFVALTTGDFTGTITGFAVTGDSPLANGETLDLSAKQKGSRVFNFGQDFNGARLPDNLDSLYEGAGWVMTSESTGTQDFLFAAFEGIIPAPTGAGVLALAGIACCTRRR